MPGKSKIDLFSSLRQEAEKFISSHKSGEDEMYSKKEIAELLHEIQVQGIELEMQNDELRSTNNELELQRAKFAGLFDLAPIGYFILDTFGTIIDLNNTGAAMLDISKNDILGKNFKNFVVKVEEGLFSDFLESIQIDEATESCPFTMLRQRDIFYAQVAGIVPARDNPEQIRCYIAVIDITDRKKAKIDHEKQVLTATIRTQENERKRISEALHDSVGQLLYGIKLKLDQQDLTDDRHKGMNQLLDQAIQETRNISFELAPSILKDFGLSVTLDEMAKRLCTPQLAIQAEIDLKGRLELNTELTVYRVIQELVNNSIKHAAASKITIVVRKENGIVIEVRDDGIGFDTKNEKTFTGSGLAAIRNRISLYGGEMFIDSVPEKGTRTLVTLIETEKKA